LEKSLFRVEVRAFIHKRTNILEMMEEFRWKEISKMKEQMREKPGEWRYKFAFLRQKEKSFYQPDIRR
jgi:hypothetical protein